MRVLTLVVVLLGTARDTRRSYRRHSQQPASEEQLRRELDAVKQQLQRVEQQMKQQEELIRKLSGEKPGTPATPSAAPAAPPPAIPSAAPPATPTPAPMAVDAEELKRMILAEIQPQLAAANKTFPSQFNPAIGFVVDSVFSYSRQERQIELRVPVGRAGDLGECRSLREGVRHHQRDGRRGRGRGSGDRHDGAPLQLDGQGRALLRRVRTPVHVPRPRSAVREPAPRPRPVRRRRIAGRWRRGELAGADRSVPDVHGRHVQQNRRRERSRQQHGAARSFGVHLPGSGGYLLQPQRFSTGSTSG